MREIDWAKDCWTWPINSAQQTRTVNPFQQKIRHLHLFTLSPRLNTGISLNFLRLLVEVALSLQL